MFTLCMNTDFGPLIRGDRLAVFPDEESALQFAAWLNLDPGMLALFKMD